MWYWIQVQTPDPPEVWYMVYRSMGRCVEELLSVVMVLVNLWAVIDTKGPGAELANAKMDD